MTTHEDLLRLREAFLATAREIREERGVPWHISPLEGHCGAVSLILHGMFGGDILTGPVNGTRHFWNRIDGKEYDLTSCQFGGDGIKPLRKGRKVDRPELIDPRYLDFATKVMGKLKKRPPNQAGERREP